MAQTLTLRVIQGADRGKVFSDLTAPITIGREEGNIVQVNDERVSRSHVKIQEKDGCLVITDLESTNGTKVNGQTCNLKILRIGDTIAVGRTVLLLDKNEVAVPPNIDGDQELEAIHVAAGDQSNNNLPMHDAQLVPGLPRSLSIVQAAELREVLDYIHVAIQDIIERASIDDKQRRIQIDQVDWRQLLAIQSEISVWIRNIEDPQASKK